jgi:hypothetical protein
MPDATALLNPNPGKCRECGIDVTGLGRGRQYCDEHRPDPRRKSKATQQRKIAKATPVKVVTDIGQAAGSRVPKAPSVEQTTKVLGRILVYITIFVAMALVSGDPGLLSEEDQERQVGELQLKDEDARSIVHPIARVLTPTKLWARYGGSIIEHSDVLDALVNLYDYASSLARYKRQRTRREQGLAAAPSNGHGGRIPAHMAPMPANEASAYDPEETWGHQIGPSPEQLDEIRRRKEAEWRQSQQ